MMCNCLYTYSYKTNTHYGGYFHRKKKFLLCGGFSPDNVKSIPYVDCLVIDRHTTIETFATKTKLHSVGIPLLDEGALMVIGGLHFTGVIEEDVLYHMEVLGFIGFGNNGFKDIMQSPNLNLHPQ